MLIICFGIISAGDKVRIPFLTYSNWAGGVMASGHNYHEGELLNFDMVSLRGDIIWMGNNLWWEGEDDELPLKSVSRVHV